MTDQDYGELIKILKHTGTSLVVHDKALLYDRIVLPNGHKLRGKTVGGIEMKKRLNK